MKRLQPKLFAVSVAGLLAATLLTVTPARAVLPNPVLAFLGQEFFTQNGKSYVRYRFEVDNRANFPSAMFVAAPGLPPCGSNTNSARTWVDIFDQRGRRLYGFCAFAKAGDLGSIWFSLEEGVVPPSYVYVELNDRQTNTKYKSNLAETTL